MVIFDTRRPNGRSRRNAEFEEKSCSSPLLPESTCGVGLLSRAEVTFAYIVVTLIEAYRMFDASARKTWSPPSSPLPKSRFDGQPDSPLCIHADALQVGMGLPAGSKLTKPQHCGRKSDDWPLERRLRRRHDSGVPNATDRLDGPIRNTGEKT